MTRICVYLLVYIAPDKPDNIHPFVLNHRSQYNNSRKTCHAYNPETFMKFCIKARFMALYYIKLSQTTNGYMQL